MLRLYTGVAGTGKTREILRQIRQAAEEGKTDLLLIVPDQFTYEAERELCEYCGNHMMYTCKEGELPECSGCGAQLEKDSAFCPACGKPVEAPAQAEINWPEAAQPEAAEAPEEDNTSGD